MTEALERPLLTDDAHRKVDALEAAMLRQLPLVDQPLTHRFTPGLYIREIFNPAGSLVTTKIHKTEHPFFVMKGRVSVGIPGQGVEVITAPFIGITKPGTRRVLFAHEDTIWVTVHANPDDETNLEVIEGRVIERRELIEGKSAGQVFGELLRRQLEGGREP